MINLKRAERNNLTSFSLNPFSIKIMFLAISVYCKLPLIFNKNWKINGGGIPISDEYFRLV